MNSLISTARREALSCLLAAAASICTGAGFAMAQDVSFDFSRLVEYRDVASSRADSPSHERIIEMKLPVSVRFQGLAVGEIELLDFEIDGTPAGIRVDSFAPTTELAADAVSVETINKTIKEK